MGKHIVVAGGSLAGQSAVSELINLAPEDEILWITGETQAAYSKPALSKEFMQARDELADILLPPVADAPGLRVLRGQPCVALDTEARSIRLADGQKVGFDHLVIATGATARMPAIFAGIEGVHALRTLEDAVAIRSSLGSKPKAVVIGGGLIGCEFAASMRTLGIEVVIVEMLERLLDRPFGGALSDYFHDLHRANGVRLELGRGVERLNVHDGRVTGVVLSDGTEIAADLVVVGAGSLPATQWLEGSGLELSDGIVCDEYLATSCPAIHAAGDVTRWFNPLFNRRMRVEHWSNASAQGRAAARNAVATLTGRADLASPFGDVPYFWSDQYGQKIQMVGWHEGHDRTEVEHPEDAPGPLVRYWRDGRLVAVAAVNAPRAVMRLRRQIEIEAREYAAAS